MWFQDTTDNRLMMSKAHGDQLRSEATEDRLPAMERDEQGVTIAVSGRHFHLGSLVIVFGRTIREDRVHHHAGVRA